MDTTESGRSLSDLHIPGYGIQLCKADHSNFVSSVVIISNSLLQHEKKRSKFKKRRNRENNKTEIEEKRMIQESFQGLFISMSISKDSFLLLLGSHDLASEASI